MSGALHDAAVSYAEAGWQVFPLSGYGGRKSPLFPSPHDGPGHGCRGECGQLGHGFYDAASDPATVSGWWTQNPVALIGGRIPRHLLVLDVDPYGGGDATLKFFETAYRPLPETLTCFSGRGDGGRHLYFKRPPTPGWRLTGTKLRPGIDLIHHELRYVVLPPSPHPKTGQSYWWDNPTVAPAEPPAWLTALLTPPRHQPTRPRHHATGGGSVAGLVSHVLRLEPKEGTGRHDTVLWALCKAYEQGAGDGDIEAICQAAETVGKPRGEIDAMRAWAAAKLGGKAV